RSWGLVAEGTTFTNYFQSGQVLFGKRRAYQRKVAVADFDGVCSGDIYVLEPKNPAVLLPKLLPFICQTEGFYEHAVGTSAGSLSPRTNWNQLAKYEFPLPPLDEQRRIAKVLLSLSKTDELLQETIHANDGVENAYLKEIFGLYGDDFSRWNKVELREIAYIQSGVAKGRKPDQEKTVDMQYITVSNVQDGRLDLSNIKRLTVEKNKVEQYRLLFGDVLMTEGGDPDKLGRGTVWQDELPGCIHQNHIFAVRPNPKILDSWFLAAVARSPYGKQFFLSRSKATSNLATINKKQVGSFLIPIPNLKKQKEIVKNWQSIRRMSTRTGARKENLQEIQSMVLNSLLGGSNEYF
ncbi:restriction endonuclease subunit S, partial [Chloroflexota bacterium]